eukprot:COSAG06_NODE_11821_length_1460_cov_1.462160_1_plen_111_part_00
MWFSLGERLAPTPRRLSRPRVHGIDGLRRLGSFSDFVLVADKGALVQGRFRMGSGNSRLISYDEALEVRGDPARFRRHVGEPVAATGNPNSGASDVPQRHALARALWAAQ